MLESPAAYLAIFLVAQLALGAAQSSRTDDVGSIEWFRAAWSKASEWKPARPLHIQVKFEKHSSVTLAELENLRKEVGTAKSGSDKRKLDQMERDFASPLLQWTVDVCTDGDRVRYAASPVQGGGALHFALDKATDWLLVNNQLRIAPSKMEKAEYGVRNYVYTSDSVVRGTVWAGLGEAPGGSFSPLSSSVQGGRWEGSVSVGGASPAVSVIRGRVARAQEPSVEGIIVERSMLADEKLRTATPLGIMDYSDWSMNTELNRWVVGTTKWVTASGRVVQTRSLQKLEFLESEEFDRLMQIPVDGTDDPWAGKVSVHSIQDVRPDHLSQVTIEKGIETPVPLQIPLQPQSRNRWVVFGIAVILGFGAVFAAWRLRRIG